MNDQQDKNLETKPNKLCTHVKKLSKKQVNQILENPAQTKCQNHPIRLDDETICLHCNKIFCGINSQQKCILTHQTVNQGHIFSLDIKNETIYCLQCSQLIDFQIQMNKNQAQNQQLKKLKRFSQFIHETQIRRKQIQQSINIIDSSINYRGLQNLGNTCFLNTDLQVLNYSQNLHQLYSQYKFVGKSISTARKSLPKQVEFFYDDVIEEGERKIWHVVTKKKDNKLHQINEKLIKTITNCKFNQLIKTFLQQMSIHDAEHPFQPTEILEFLAHIDKKYSLQQQQDAEQALLFIIDVLVQGQLTTMGYDMQRYSQVQKLIGRQKISPLQRVIGTYLVSQVFCQNCKKINYTFDLSYHLSIDLETKVDKSANSIMHHLSKDIDMKQKIYHKNLRYPRTSQNGIFLPQFLYSFFQQERLTQRENYYSCSNCKSLVGLKKFYLVDLPEILIISIKRFNHKLVKNSKHVFFEEFIDLKDVVLVTLNEDGQKEDTNTKYRLYAVIVHLGQTIHNGHYVCFVRTKQNIWLRCSDHVVKKVSWKQVKEQQAYVILYQRVNYQK